MTMMYRLTREIAFTPGQIAGMVISRWRLVLAIYVLVLALTACYTTFVSVKYEGYGMLVLGGLLGPEDRTRLTQEVQRAFRGVNCELTQDEDAGVLTTRCQAPSRDQALQKVQRANGEILARAGVAEARILKPLTEEIKAIQRFSDRTRPAVRKLTDQYIQFYFDFDPAVLNKYYDLTTTRVLFAPVASEEPVQPRWVRNLVLASILGVVLGTLLALMRGIWQLIGSERTLASSQENTTQKLTGVSGIQDDIPLEARRAR